MKESTKIKVAIVEDIVLVRMGIASLLAKNEDYEVVLQADNGREFLDKMDEGKYDIDICLLDIQMPEMDGHKTIPILKKLWPNTKVLVLSMFNDDYNVIRMLRNGANGYVLKNCSGEELDKAIKEVLNKGFYHSDLVNEHFFHLMQNRDDGSALTEKDLTFLSYCCSELTYKEIAELMRLSPRTIEGYRDALCEKLNIKSRTGLVMYALRIGVTPYAIS